jgi:Arc/MetJ-type ribon-helix-helix transcriptional regulator
MIQVQVRLPEEDVEILDKWVKEKKFKSRSDAMRATLAFYKEREKTIGFYKMLVKRDRETQKNPNLLIPIDEIE